MTSPQPLTSIFRKEALEHRHRKHWGSVWRDGRASKGDWMLFAGGVAAAAVALVAILAETGLDILQ
jgi:hypothetical protein